MLEKYNYELPPGLIAQEPAKPRDSARLLIYDTKTGEITDSVFWELDSFLPKNSTLVLNNSKVENCRWLFGRDEVFVLEKNDPYTIRAMVRPGKKFKMGGKYSPTNWLEFEVTGIDSEGIRTLKLNVQHDNPKLKEFEHVPLPPYIVQNDELAKEYQTVYAKPLGSLAAPTAGLHFTDELLESIKAAHQIAEVTLHVGLGTFAKISDEDIVAGKLHEEYYFLDKNTSRILNNSDDITAVGTTTVRTLESSYSNGFSSKTGSTDIFIKPGFRFNAVNHLITNFHLPSTSLMIMVAAFITDKKNISEQAAIDELLKIYKHAVDNRYRFYSFGDAMLLL